MQRRDFLRAFAALIAAGLPLPGRSAAGPATTLSPLGKPQVFDYAWLKGQARALANGVYQPPVSHIPDAVKALDWDQYQAIRYRADHALWAKDRLRFQVKFFHLGLYYQSPVRMYEVVDGQAQELAYDPAHVRLRQERFDRARACRRTSASPASACISTPTWSATSWPSLARATSVR